MNLYEAIYARRSVRSYRMDPIDDKILKAIPDFLDEMNPLFPEIRTKVKLYDNVMKRVKIKGILIASAPYYAVIYSENKEKRDMNAGTIMQQLSLYLTSKGIGSCYLGMGKKFDKELQEEGLDFVMVMAFGYGKGNVLRHEHEAKRLSLEELCAYKEKPRNWVKEILEVSRLAPSSFNGQPWRFVVYENRIHVFSKKPVVTHSALGKHNEFNFGIMLANVMVAAEEIWVDLDLIKLNNITHKSLSNNQYVLSILLKA